MVAGEVAHLADGRHGVHVIDGIANDGAGVDIVDHHLCFALGAAAILGAKYAVKIAAG